MANAFVHLCERVWQRVVVKDDGCWMWLGKINKYGYARLDTSRQGTVKTQTVHRLTYRMLRGPIPDGLDLDHLCRVRLCVNPDHLEPVTRLENTARGKAARLACRRGHPYDEANTYRRLDRNGKQIRSCRRCNAAAVARHKGRDAQVRS